MKHLSYYGLSHNPFEKGVDIKQKFESQDYKQATSRLEYLKSVKGIGVFTGNSGMGKTYTMRCFRNSLNPSLYKVVYLAMSTLTVLEFYKALAYGLGIEPAFKKIDIFKQIQETIEHMSKEKRMIPTIIIDEAQYLKTDILNDLKILLNFQMDSTNPCIVILTGQNILKNTLNKNIHEALQQRIVINYTFEGISKSEIASYIQASLANANVNVPLFTDGAIEAIASCSGGSLRKLNSILTNCLIAGCQKDEKEINTDTVMRAQNEVELI
ncbi:type II secretory pathway predicted ATPase ExeA [Breznakia blatticola]|uniref:Type II secretory pathway predicted ATPase ExeA n=1 Tax=Breznakia blatticola TaxID=1754012 RepID=A0A4R7ZF82_9FIRM|nr:AAA family ATPase [Breznakia blatticola]TDW08039.1 type II secretory pathway predicted ATPase ExeA [Breznakia blatticola]